MSANFQSICLGTNKFNGIVDAKSGNTDNYNTADIKNCKSVFDIAKHTKYVNNEDNVTKTEAAPVAKFRITNNIGANIWGTVNSDGTYTVNVQGVVKPAPPIKTETMSGDEFSKKFANREIALEPLDDSDEIEDEDEKVTTVANFYVESLGSKIWGTKNSDGTYTINSQAVVYPAPPIKTETVSEEEFNEKFTKFKVIMTPVEENTNSEEIKNQEED